MDNTQMISKYNVPTYDQYLLDLKTLGLNKICMTEVVNADMMIAIYGEALYSGSVTDVLDGFNKAIIANHLEKTIFFYNYSYKNFIIAAGSNISDEDFIMLTRSFHNQYELSTSDQVGLTGIAKFCVAMGDGNLTDKAKSALYANRDEQLNFIIASNETDLLHKEAEEDVRIFGLINEAIDKGYVIPYYQGIYDNDREAFTRYEALMRISDSNNNIYPPGLFLSRSKKLKLYLKLSQIMLDKALSDFENLTSKISLNITLHDVKSKAFKTWLLSRIAAHPTPSQIILEFVETENYNDNSELTDFLLAARNLGCKIAIDDFGVGFASYSSVISLKPDIIKIDGALIKNLVDNEENKLILESITYLAKLIGAEVVAEFVENEEIQNIILDYGVRFSQGYFFAKPEPFDKI